MIISRIVGIEKPASRLVLGSLAIATDEMERSFSLLDAFIDAGGTCIETAWNYRQGKSEAAIGEWLRRRRLRDKVILITKGGQPPNCHPDGIIHQLNESLERLGLSGVDLYLIHKDDPAMGVEPFVDCLNTLATKGLMSAFGVSNWTPQRIEQANAYAHQSGQRGLVAASPHFSLAEWSAPPWSGCLHARDPQAWQWYHDTQFPLLAWSSQAHGFFARTPNEPPPSPAELPHHKHVWMTQANQQRLVRVWELAETRGVPPMRIALAYVLNQPLNIFPIIGPQTIEELHDCVLALDLALTPQELGWLNLEPRYSAAPHKSR